MNNEDMSDIIQKLSSMMNNSNNTTAKNNNDNDASSSSDETSYENLQNILHNLNFNSQNEANNEQTNNNFDFETIMKMKNVMDKFQSNKNKPETNLLLALKPYLNDNRKQKVDQYIQFLNIAKLFEALNPKGGTQK